MGYKTEINYILKSSSTHEDSLINLKEGSSFLIQKSGLRTYILNSPIFFADSQWNILGMCIIYESSISRESTVLKAKILTVLSKEESQIVSKIIQDGEKRKDIL